MAIENIVVSNLAIYEYYGLTGFQFVHKVFSDLICRARSVDCPFRRNQGIASCREKLHARFKIRNLPDWLHTNYGDYMNLASESTACIFTNNLDGAFLSNDRRIYNLINADPSSLLQMCIFFGEFNAIASSFRCFGSGVSRFSHFDQLATIYEGHGNSDNHGGYLNSVMPFLPVRPFCGFCLIGSAYVVGIRGRFAFAARRFTHAGLSLVVLVGLVGLAIHFFVY